MTTTFLGYRKLNKAERDASIPSGADLVFLREDHKGREIKIFVILPDGDISWSQWGASTEALADNVKDLEEYIKENYI